MWVSAGMGFYAFPIFFVELSEVFGWEMAKINAGFAVSMLCGGLVSPLVGLLLPRLGSKKVIVTGALIMSTSFVLFSAMYALWQYLLICIVLAVGWTCTGSIPTTYSISDWFEKKRGRATGIMMVGVGLGGWSIAPLTRRLIDVLGWKETFVAYAIVTTAILVPIAALIYKRRPAELGVLPDGRMPDEAPDSAENAIEESATADTGWEFRDAVRTHVFWLISITFILVTFGQTALLLNIPTHLKSIGVSPKSAASALGTCAMLGMAGKLFFGWMADRYSARRAMIVSFGLQAVGTVLLIYTSTLGSPYWFVLVWGFAMGGVVALEPLIVAECFGLKSFGVILGMVYVFTTIGSSIGPVFAGYIFDIRESYILAFVVFAVTYTLATGLSFLAIPPDKPSQGG
jgi:MFS family permease